MTKYDGMDWIYIYWLFYFSLQKWKLYYLKFPFLCWYGRIYLFDLFIYFAIKTVLQEDYLTFWGRFLFSDADKNVSQKTHVVVKASEAATGYGEDEILFWTGVSHSLSSFEEIFVISFQNFLEIKTRVNDLLWFCFEQVCRTRAPLTFWHLMW